MSVLYGAIIGLSQKCMMPLMNSNFIQRHKKNKKLWRTPLGLVLQNYCVITLAYYYYVLLCFDQEPYYKDSLLELSHEGWGWGVGVFLVYSHTSAGRGESNDEPWLYPAHLPRIYSFLPITAN